MFTLKDKSKTVKIVALIVAAGTGERFGGLLPKQYMSLSGKPVLKWSVDVFKNHPQISHIVVVVNHEHLGSFKEAIDRLEPELGVELVTGGMSRQQSVARGLEALKKYNPDFVLIHDAARPLLSTELINTLCQEVVVHSAVIPALPITDSVKRKTDTLLSTESRESLFAAQTPQAFNFMLIHILHKKYPDRPVSDDAMLCEIEKLPVKIIPGEFSNIKITHPEDMMIAKHYILNQYNDVRCGHGFDVHRLVPATEENHDLIICGVKIPYHKTLHGHSDADVGLHAITDAILATICDGDIGEHFDPNDEQWKNADSAIFLKYAEELVIKKHGFIAHIDVTIIAEEPKISPYRDEMKNRIAHILGIASNRISVKATTTEGLGFTGRGEGIAAQAVVTARFKAGAI